MSDACLQLGSQHRRRAGLFTWHCQENDSRATGSRELVESIGVLMALGERHEDERDAVETLHETL